MNQLCKIGLRPNESLTISGQQEVLIVGLKSGENPDPLPPLHIRYFKTHAGVRIRVQQWGWHW
jgi:hypothetical protein